MASTSSSESVIVKSVAETALVPSAYDILLLVLVEIINSGGEWEPYLYELKDGIKQEKGLCIYKTKLQYTWCFIHGVHLFIR